MTVKILRGVEAVDFVTNSSRPAFFDKKGVAYGADGLKMNSFLTREEWEKLDSVIVARAQQQLNAYQDLVDANLTTQTTLAEEFSKWRVASERIAADVTMDFRTRRNRDRTDMKTYGVPVPIISAEYEIGRRELLVARAAGRDVEVTEADAAAIAVTEKAEDILMNGETGIVVHGSNIPGYRTLAARDSNTAAGYGGGDFGTISQIRPTFLGMMSALAANRYMGPFGCYIANTQYHEMLDRHTDGSGQTAIETVESIPQIEYVKANDLVPAGELVMVQLTRDVVDLVIALSLENRQWESPDGSALFFVVMMSAIPRLRTDYAGTSGIAHATGC